MQRRRLGGGGPEISAVGFGSWAVGGPWQWGWGPQDDAVSIATIRHAVEAGVNWVDTAAVYGLGHSEEVVSKALSPFSVGEDVYVFTKCGLNWYDDPGQEDHSDLRPESIRFEVDRSLERLGVERIDLLQFHWPDEETGTPIEDSWGAMHELVEEGKVRWAGVSNFDVPLLERCEAIRSVDALQAPFSLLHRGARRDVIPWCRQRGAGVIAYSPMGSGVLTGAFSRERLNALPTDDWRRKDDDFKDPFFGRSMELVERLGPVADRLGVSIASLVVSWVLHTDGVTGAICGARKPEQVDDWLRAPDISLDQGVLHEIEALVTETGAGDEIFDAGAGGGTG